MDTQVAEPRLADHPKIEILVTATRGMNTFMTMTWDLRRDIGGQWLLEVLDIIIGHSTATSQPMEQVLKIVFIRL
jgi:hypothetical protein